jgi:heptosyltransferase-3
MSLPPVLVSRADRLGDLVLSIPTLKFLRDHGFGQIVLRVSAYAKDVGLWAKANGYCDEVVSDGDTAAPFIKPTHVLCLFYDPNIGRSLKAHGIQKSWGPRSRLQALWTFSKSVAQHRSRVAMSEMHYNLDLARVVIKDLGQPLHDFSGCPPLAIPSDWAALNVPKPEVVVNLANRGSAANWGVTQYLEWVRQHRAQNPKAHVTFLLSGDGAAEIEAELTAGGILGEPRVALQKSFSTVRELIVFLSRASLVVSSSTGPLHIAHAAGVEVLGLYPTKRVESFDRWRPDGFWHQAPVSLIEF